MDVSTSLVSTSIHLDQNFLAWLLSYESVYSVLHHHQMTYVGNVLLVIYSCCLSTDRLWFYNACCLHKTTSLMKTWYSEFYRALNLCFPSLYRYQHVFYMFNILFKNYSDYFKQDINDLLVMINFLWTIGVSAKDLWFILSIYHAIPICQIVQHRDLIALP